jgi:PPOX class probable F420-dependent enzyme
MQEDEARAKSSLSAEPSRGSLSAAEQNAFFKRPLLARMATVGADGAPYVVPLWYEWAAHDGTFWFVIREKARFMPHILREPRVCLSIASDAPPYARATISGKAEIVGRPGDSFDWRSIGERMARNYIGDRGAGYIDATAPFPRWTVRVVPTATTTWRGGGWARYYTSG